MKLFLAICFVATMPSLFEATNYCEPSLCDDDETHVACDAGSELEKSSCKVIPVESAEQSLIVKLHNEFRNKVATGKQEYPGGFYPEAARMTTMQWDDDLAFVAAANARKCEFEHDQCRNSVRYPASGQNIAYSGQSSAKADVSAVITKLINKWYGEYKDANPEYTAEYPKDYEGPAIGHFTQIIADRADRIGCAMVQWTEKPWVKFYLVCNYARTNVIEKAIYVAGDVASECTTGTNSDYPGLCSEEEPVDYAL
ncbi:antigen 5 like allergen Cul n 1-like [Uranotaenia lowii]|uniref:antigen 5 like allergen Cul n 1-like n=1 Tax=Uranotaenia lowii TaxID=190385 RepID=UPI0024784465|nr:antigen 5 like allergen Cul n 1-like [Uranotaenia lowii]